MLLKLTVLEAVCFTIFFAVDLSALLDWIAVKLQIRSTKYLDGSFSQLFERNMVLDEIVDLSETLNLIRDRDAFLICF